jgi:hypothetical protein
MVAMHLREGTSEVVGVAVLKAAAICVLGELQRGEQANQFVFTQVPAAGVSREEGAGVVQG